MGVSTYGPHRKFAQATLPFHEWHHRACGDGKVAVHRRQQSGAQVCWENPSRYSNVMYSKCNKNFSAEMMPVVIKFDAHWTLLFRLKSVENKVVSGIFPGLVRHEFQPFRTVWAWSKVSEVENVIVKSSAQYYLSVVLFYYFDIV
jgi:hypothetical protein